MFEIIWALAMAAAPDTITLKQAVEIALAGNPEVKMEQSRQDAARFAVAEGKSRFVPEVFAGSGLAWTRGIPQSIGGSPPSALQVIGGSALLNMPLKHGVRELQAMARAGLSGVEAKRQEIAFRVASTYMDLDRAARSRETARREAESLAKLESLTAARVKEGVEIPLEVTRARLSVAKSRQRIVELEGRIASLEMTLRALLNFPEDRLIQTAAEPDNPAWRVSVDSKDERAAVDRAWATSPALKKLAEEVEAAESRVKAEKAERLPQVDFVAQYALLTRFNNFEDFYRRFERHNAQLGASIKIPLFAEARIAARVGIAESGLAAKRLALENAKRQAALSIRHLFQSVRQQEAGREVMKLELDIARENAGVALARFQEGRAGGRDLEQARLEEIARWNAFLEAGFDLDRSRLELMKITGEISKMWQ